MLKAKSITARKYQRWLNKSECACVNFWKKKFHCT